MRRAKLLTTTALVLAASIGLSACTSVLSGPPPDTYDLSAPDTFPGLTGSSRAQILILEPSALKILDSENIVIKPSEAEAEYLAKSQWTDRLPKLVQAKLIETFENTERVRAVAKPGDGLVIDYQIVTEIRAFDATIGSGISEARVALSVKLVSDRTGKVVRTRVFQEAVPINGGGSLEIVLGLDAAFDNVARDLVAWTFAGV